jgi:hypothetical protein
MGAFWGLIAGTTWRFYQDRNYPKTDTFTPVSSKRLGVICPPFENRKQSSPGQISLHFATICRFSPQKSGPFS